MATGRGDSGWGDANLYPQRARGGHLSGSCGQHVALIALPPYSTCCLGQVSVGFWYILVQASIGSVDVLACCLPTLRSVACSLFLFFNIGQAYACVFLPGTYLVRNRLLENLFRIELVDLDPGSWCFL